MLAFNPSRPVGVVASSWGGTPINVCVSVPAARSSGCPPPPGPGSPTVCVCVAAVGIVRGLCARARVRVRVCAYARVRVRVCAYACVHTRVCIRVCVSVLAYAPNAGGCPRRP
jgi:hypothetical protein